jgi:hypothetical protein
MCFAGTGKCKREVESRGSKTTKAKCHIIPDSSVVLQNKY